MFNPENDFKGFTMFYKQDGENKKYIFHLFQLFCLAERKKRYFNQKFTSPKI